jgi:hypothetical protein
MVVLAMRMMSPTNRRKYAREELCLKMNKEEYLLEAEKPIDRINDETRCMVLV